MSLQAGNNLGPYEILSPIGAGGMGEVYKARDTRLDRTVAIKVSKEAFSERFGREARTVAALNHPHICQVYDVGPNYLVMELIDGSPLKGPLPGERAVEYASQILDALDAAHRQGITHRDLKPANILVTKQGIKLLDFGLAKRSTLLSETDVTRALTEQGQIVGTLQYMSPEQLQGKEADARSDLFSFGCVMYEMLTGNQAFDGKSTASVIAAILEREPSPLPASSGVDRVVRRCIAKDPDQRFQNAQDLKVALRWALDQPARAAQKPGWRWIAAGAAILMLGILGGGWARSYFRQPPGDDRVIRFQIAAPEGSSIFGTGSFGATIGGGFAVSPDGQALAFVTLANGRAALWVRSLDSANGRLIRGSEGAAGPFWSPDSRSLAFATGRTLQRLDLRDDTISRICDIGGVYTGGFWFEDGRILFSVRDVGIFQVPVLGGTPSQITTLDREHGEGNHSLPRPLPRGRFLYIANGSDPQRDGIYAASFTKPAERVRVLPQATPVEYVSSENGKGYLVWVRERTLVAQRFNIDRLELSGSPIPLADPVVRASTSGRVLVYGSNNTFSRFKWRDRKGNDGGWLGEPGPWVFSSFSPDGRRLATIRSGDSSGIWVLETGRGVATRFISGPGIRIGPVWSPDGNTIVFAFGSPFNIFRMASNGTGAEESVSRSSDNQVPIDWSRDGRFILFNQIASDTGSDIWALPVTPEGRVEAGATPLPFIRERFDQVRGRFSPNARWVAYESNESGQNEIYLRSFPDGREKIRISASGGTYPEWGPDGRELFYRSRDGKLMSVNLKPAGTTWEAAPPRELFTFDPSTGLFTAGASYEVTPDGQRFLTKEIAASPEPLNVIVNWSALLKKGTLAQ